MMVRRGKIESDEVRTQDLFGSEVLLQLPPFQRRYDWQPRNINRLLDDIDEIIAQERNSKFLGAIVLEDISSGLAMDPSKFTVVDGQQRLTTLYLAITAIAVIAAKRKEPEAKELSADIVRRYLLNGGRKHLNEPKLLPTFQDLHQFRTVLANLPSQPAVLPHMSGDDKDTMLRAYDLIVKSFNQRVRKEGLNILEQLLDIILTKLKFVQLILSSEDDPKNVFDSLNDTGISLGNFDLVRNHIFSKYDTASEDQVRLAEASFTTRWPQIEGRLINNPPKSDPARFLFPFAIIHFPNTTKSVLFEDLTSRWSNMGPEEVLQDLQVYVEPFLSITHTIAPELRLSEELTTSLERLIRLQAPTSVYPFLMRIVKESADGTLKAADASRCVSLVESFLVRRGILGIEPTGLHAVFRTMWAESKGAQPTELLRKLTSNQNQPFPDDTELATAIRKGDLYHRKGVVKHVLREYELYLMSAAKDKAQLPNVSDQSIEHIMPQTLGPGWPGVSDTDHKELEHTWANLLLVSSGFNSSLGNKSWSDKRTLLSQEAVFRAARKVAADNEEWTYRQIEDRSASLVEYALKRWPRDLG